MNRLIDEMQRMIVVASGNSPAWLAEKKDVNWLQALYELVKAGIVLVENDKPKLAESASAVLMIRYGSQLQIVYEDLRDSGSQDR